MAATGKKTTGTGDTVYDLVSIIYHALQGAETYGMYIADAEEVGDAELARFLRRWGMRSWPDSSRRCRTTSDSAQNSGLLTSADIVYALGA